MDPERIYPPEDFDGNFALKPSPALVLLMFYAARHFLFVLLAYNPSPRLGSAFGFLQHYTTPISLLFGLPALLVILAWLRRMPKAESIWRVVWRRGKGLLSLSILSHFVFLAHSAGPDILASYVLSDSARLVVVNLGVDVLALYYLWRSPRVSDVFADFPARPQTP